MITADRPEGLRRCLDSYLRHFSTYGRSLRIVVIDGSRDECNRRMNRQTIGRLTRAQQSLVYVGRQEARCLRSRLARLGVRTAVLRSGLVPGAIGANRNLALLVTAGEHVLMTDDDMVCHPWSRQRPGMGLVVSGHGDPRFTEFFDTRADALKAAGQADCDLVASHMALLGRPLHTILHAYSLKVDLREACSHTLAALAEGRPQQVRITFSGVAGDAGTYCAYTRLFSAEATRRKMASDERTYERALGTREVLSSAETATITHDSRCMAGSMALANTTFVPPFLPIGRNEDGVFGAMLGAIDDSALFAHLPVGVIHDSDRPAQYAQDRPTSASQTRLSELMIALIRSTDLSMAQSPYKRYELLATLCRDMSTLGPREFRMRITRATLDARARQLRRIDNMLSRADEYSDRWRSDLEVFRETLVTSLGRPSFFVPIEFYNGHSVEEGFRNTRLFLAGFAALLHAWPVLWREAAMWREHRR